MSQQLGLDFGTSGVSPEEEHLFRRWRANLGCMEELAREHGKTEVQMLGVIAGIWRRMR